MYVKLIQPKMERRPMDSAIKSRMAPPLGLLTVAAIVRQDHRVVLEDENIRPVVYDDRPDLVGITVTVDALPRAISIARRFRALGVPVVAGGIHITTAWDTVPPDAFDALCIGAAEGTWPDILRDAAAGQLRPVYRCARPLTGTDIVSPAYDLLTEGAYLYCNIVHTSRGCPFRCDFCYNSAPERQYVKRPVADVLRDIRAVGARHIMFIDDNFAGDIPWTYELVRALKPLNIKWNAAVSVDIARHGSLLDEMRASGCESLFLGFESISGENIAGVHKVQNDTAQYDAVVEALHSRGIMINASFVFGLDGDTPETFRRTLEWIVTRRIETVTSHILTPYPGTALYARMAAQGRIVTEDLSRYNTAHVVFRPAGMTEEELYAGYLWLYRQVYSFRNILRRLPRARGQRPAYLAFNLLYRKFGRWTDLLCRLIGYARIGRWGERLARYPR